MEGWVDMTMGKLLEGREMVRQSSEGRACGGGFGKGSVRKRWGDQAGRMWEALLAGVGGGEEGSRECLPGKYEERSPRR